jgi:hypothetical protein
VELPQSRLSTGFLNGWVFLFRRTTAVLTDRDKIRLWIKVQTDDWEETFKSITVRRGAKYIFTDDGELKTIVKHGKSYNGEAK